MDENRKKALAAALTQIERQFGKGSVMRLGDEGAMPGIEAVSTGSLGLDIALGIGGLPKGRVIEIGHCPRPGLATHRHRSIVPTICRQTKLSLHRPGVRVAGVNPVEQDAREQLIPK